MEVLLLAKTWGTDFKQGLPRLLYGQFQSCRSTLALAAIPQDVPEPALAHGLAKQVARTWSKLPLMMLPPGVDCFRLGPREVFIWVHIDIFILRVLGGPGFEAFWPFALKVFVGDVYPRNHREGFPGNTS